MAVSNEVANLCRLCMAPAAADKRTHIFEDNSKSSDFAMKIMSTLGVEVHKIDPLPKQMCMSCVYQLEKFYIFRKLCRKTDSKFRSFVRKVKSKRIQRLDELSDDDDDHADSADDTNLAFVQEYERSYMQEEHKRQLRAQLKEEMVTGRKQLLQQIKRTLYETIDSLVDTEMHENTDVSEENAVSPKTTLNPSKAQEKRSAPSIAYRQQSPKRAVKRTFETLKIEESESIAEEVANAREEEEEEADYDFQKADEEEEPEDEDGEEEQEDEEELEHQDTDQKPSVMVKHRLIHGCRKCDRKFNSAEKLEKHQIYHINERNVCEDCGKCFSSSGSLFRHIRIHSATKEHKCDVCDKSFIQKGSLLRHTLVHQKDRPFPCSECDRTFSQKNLLREHMNKAHSSSNVTYVFRCDQCPKTFRYASGLSRHALSHSGLDFPCSKCERTLSDYSSLQRHMKLVHKSEN